MAPCQPRADCRTTAVFGERARERQFYVRVFVSLWLAVAGTDAGVGVGPMRQMASEFAELGMHFFLIYLDCNKS